MRIAHLAPTLALLFVATACHAEIINLDFAVDLVFQNGVLRDANPEGPASAVVEITRPQDPIPNSVEDLSPRLFAGFDLEVTGLEDLEVNGPPSFSDAGGVLTISLPGGQEVRLTLNELQLSYNDRAQSIVVFAEGSEFTPPPEAPVTSNPAQLTLAPAPVAPVSISFSAPVNTSQVDTSTSPGTSTPTRTVTTFTARARGNILNAVLVPEPSTWMVACFLAVAGSAGMRRRGNLR